MTSALVLPLAYPSHRVADVALLDGSTVTVRPVLPEDADEVMALFGRLSATSTANRFHGMHRLTRREADYFTGVDYVKTFGLVAEHGSGTARHIVALASYIQTHPGIAECAFVVDDALQGRGLGALMLEHLAEAASQAGVDRSKATSIWLMSEPGCGDDPLADRGGGCARTTSFVAGVRFDVTGAGPVRTDIFCGVGPPSLVCSETPRACGHNALVRARVVQKNPRDPVAGASRHDLDEPRA